MTIRRNDFPEYDSFKEIGEIMEVFTEAIPAMASARERDKLELL